MLRLVSDSVHCMLGLSLGAVTLVGIGFMAFFICCLVAVGMVCHTYRVLCSVCDTNTVTL